MSVYTCVFLPSPSFKYGRLEDLVGSWSGKTPLTHLYGVEGVGKSLYTNSVPKRW